MHETAEVIRDGPLGLTITHDGVGRTIAASGELELASMGALEALLEEIAERDDGTVLVLDLAELEFIDSCGMALLVRAHQRLNADGRERMRLGRPRTVGVKRVLAATELDAKLPFVSAASSA